MEAQGLAPEQHDSLPEIVEPAENPALVGHQREAEKLVRAYRNGRLHHALMLCGPRGIGKATFAFAIARHLLHNPLASEAPDVLSQPGQDSPVFRQIASGAHPALLHLTRPLDKDGKKFKTAITVDEIRRVSKFLSMTSHDGSYRIVIVDPADDMNTSAANALLKNLEEPPNRTLFVLISHAPGRLLATIRSRCQIVRLHPLGNDDLTEVLNALGENAPSDTGQRETLVDLAGGSPRNALLLTRYGGLELTETLDKLLESSKLDLEKAYKLADAVSGRDADIQFSIVNDAILDRIAGRARKMAADGKTAESARWSNMWYDASEEIRQTSIFNLDKKQHLVGLISKLHGH
ncbi:MAG: DNA polymerase III subunit delta' [Rhizobiaceae bacterium]